MPCRIIVRHHHNCILRLVGNAHEAIRSRYEILQTSVRTNKPRGLHYSKCMETGSIKWGSPALLQYAVRKERFVLQGTINFDESSMILYIDNLYSIYLRIIFPWLINWINLKLIWKLERSGLNEIYKKDAIWNHFHCWKLNQVV